MMEQRRAPTKARSKLSQPGDVRPLHNGGGGPVYREWSVGSRSGTRSFLAFTAFRNNIGPPVVRANSVYGVGGMDGGGRRRPFAARDTSGAFVSRFGGVAVVVAEGRARTAPGIRHQISDQLIALTETAQGTPDIPRRAAWPRGVLRLALAPPGERDGDADQRDDRTKDGPGRLYPAGAVDVGEHLGLNGHLQAEAKVSNALLSNNQ